MTGPPTRVRLSRAKGWRMPPNTVKVDRTTALGNPFIVNPHVKPGSRSGAQYFCVPTAEDAVACFREMFTLPGQTADGLRAALPGLRGKNVACWCALDAPCHGDVWLELANPPPAPTIPCPGCGAACDSSAVGDHTDDCPDYGPNAPTGPEDYGHPSPEDHYG